jgi:transcriptional regulator with XRE-family HTH domain
MNFGDRLKQLRTQKNLTQPQLAQAIGIEQSYLSKLENDKSIPGADIFQSILRALNVDVATFLQGVDDNFVHRELRQVPEVANHLNGQMAVRIHSVKRWLFLSGIAGVLGLTLFFAGQQKLLGSGFTYTYESPGVAHADEPTDIFGFGMADSWLQAEFRAGEITEADFAKRRLEIMSRMKSDIVILDESRGDGFIAQVPGGTRLYKLKGSAYNDPPANRYAMFGGLLLAFASLFGFIIEARLRSLKKP